MSFEENRDRFLDGSLQGSRSRTLTSMGMLWSDHKVSGRALR